MDYFMHPEAIVETSHIGSKSRVSAFTHILPGAVFGSDVNVGNGVETLPGTYIAKPPQGPVPQHDPSRLLSGWRSETSVPLSESQQEIIIDALVQYSTSVVADEAD